MSEEAKAKAKSALDDLPKCYAHFRAKYLHALRGVLDLAREEQFLHQSVGLFIEPAEKGVILIANDGRVMAAIYDAEGNANRPFRALLPKAFCDRAAPAAPLKVFDQGPEEIDLPEWAQPGLVVISPICATILPQMSHPAFEDDEDGYALASVRIETGNIWRADDFRLQEDKQIPWRRLLQGPFEPQASAHISPHYYAAFQPLIELFADERAGTISVKFNASKERPFVIQIAGAPEFVGAIAGMRADGPPPMPEWLKEAAKKAEPRHSEGSPA